MVCGGLWWFVALELYGLYCYNKNNGVISHCFVLWWFELFLWHVLVQYWLRITSSGYKEVSVICFLWLVVGVDGGWWWWLMAGGGQ